MSQPIRVLIGFLPEVTEKDAELYARGVAEQNFTSLQNGFYFLMSLSGGYAYEVQEGGDGRAYLPGVIKALQNAPLETDSEVPVVYIATATRTVRVDMEDGLLSAVLLPESDASVPTPGLENGPRMKPLIPSAKQVLLVGCAMLGLGLLVLGAGLVFRQFYSNTLVKAATRQPPVVALANLPINQWTVKIQKLPMNEQVKALRYKNGKWAMETQTVNVPPTPAPAIQPAPALPPGSPATPVVATPVPGPAQPVPAAPRPAGPQPAPVLHPAPPLPHSVQPVNTGRKQP